MKYLVLGSTGLLGQYLAAEFKDLNNEVVLHGFKNSCDVCFDCTNQIEVINNLKEIKPNFLINLVSLTDVEQCEQEPNRAHQLNTSTVKNIVESIASINYPIKLVHISTDHLYDCNGPSKEADVSIKNTYAQTKLLGEQACTAPGSLIIRTNFFGKSKSNYRKSLSDAIIENLSSGRNFQAFHDVYFSPLSIRTLVKFINMSVKLDLSGVYNLGASTGMSKYEFAQLILQEMGYDQRLVVPISIDERQDLIARRPKNMIMDSTKFELATSSKLPELDAEIKNVVKEYQI
jgi:dTDP-4-dehydrorhamnose reductase